MYLYPLLTKYIGVNNLRKAGLYNASSQIYELLYYELKMMSDISEYDIKYIFRNSSPEYLKELNITNSEDIYGITEFMFGWKSNIVFIE